MDANPPKTHRKAFLATRIPSRVCFPLSFAFGGLGSIGLVVCGLLLGLGPEKYFPEMNPESLHNSLIGTISTCGGLFAAGIYFFACGIALVIVSEHLQIKDKEKGYDYSGL